MLRKYFFGRSSMLNTVFTEDKSDDTDDNGDLSNNMNPIRDQPDIQIDFDSDTEDFGA